ncbi:MAG: diaminopimelate decarboxylase [Deltaproteobacteria bacterium]|nr:diaminopimelate decarboxylase [Deltaproteobacteria bacterium]
MKYFAYKDNALFCEDLPVSEIAKKVGTPVYVYSYRALKETFDRFSAAFGGTDHLICFSMKANSNGAVLRTFVKAGGGIDVVTGGELERAMAAGCDPKKIVFSGVGKSSEEIKTALVAGILQFNVESEEELENISRIASDLGKKAPVAIRVNPDVDPKTHASISTGLKSSKFGICHDNAVEIYARAAKMRGIEIVGIDCHIGSQITRVEPFVEAVRKARVLMEKIKKRGIALKNLDIGGGLGIVYKDETPPTAEEYASAVKKEIAGLDCKLILEPGRFLAGNAGVLVTQVLYNKEREAKKFVIVDAASNDLMRPALYDAFHKIEPLHVEAGREKVHVDVVGPICETGDFFAKERPLQTMLPGECLAIMGAGAYGFSMSSNYNSRPRPAEVMVNGRDSFVVRERETVKDVVKGEKVPGFLK